MPFQISKELKRIAQQILRFCFRVECRLQTCIFLLPLRAAPHSRVQSENRLDNGVISINLSRTFFTGIGHVLEYIDQVLKIHSF